MNVTTTTMSFFDNTPTRCQVRHRQIGKDHNTYKFMSQKHPFLAQHATPSLQCDFCGYGICKQCGAQHKHQPANDCLHIEADLPPICHCDFNTLTRTEQELRNKLKIGHKLRNCHAKKQELVLSMGDHAACPAAWQTLVAEHGEEKVLGFCEQIRDQFKTAHRYHSRNNDYVTHRANILTTDEIHQMVLSRQEMQDMMTLFKLAAMHFPDDVIAEARDAVCNAAAFFATWPQAYDQALQLQMYGW